MFPNPSGPAKPNDKSVSQTPSPVLSVPVLGEAEGTHRKGGRRPGAGAPKGNLNALKHGRRSQQFAELGALIAGNPAVCEALLDLARKHKVKQAKADEIAAALFAQLILRAHEISGGKLFDDSPTRDRRSIDLNVAALAEIVAQIDPKLLRKASK